MLEIQSLSVQLGSRVVLQNVHFTQSSGAILAVIGPNGAGKTTLIRAISGVIPVLEGNAQIDGVDLHSMTASQRAKLVAVVPQTRSLPESFTAWQTVAIGRTPHLNWFGQMSENDKERVDRAMQRTSTLELRDQLVSRLSGGELQRVLLARALAQETPLLLLDEPTTHLDLQFQISLLDLVRQLAIQDHLTVLIALHDLNLVARYSDQVLLLVKGQQIAYGTPKDVLQPDQLSQAFQIPVQVIPGPNSGSAVVLPGCL